MLSFFRRLINSRLGVAVTMLAIAMLVVLFALSDISSWGNGAGSGKDSAPIAKVGSTTITAGELSRRVKADVENFRAQQPTLTLQQFIDGGGFDGTVDRLIDGQVLEQFARRHGMTVSKQAIDARLAAIPQLQGIDGKFDQKVYEQLLAQRRLTDADIRSDIARSILIEQLTAPTSGAGQVPVKVAQPYADLLLEKRRGSIAFIPTRAIGAGAQPTADELKTFYQRNAARYVIPERRAIQYALVTPDAVKAAAAPSETEIAAAYRAQAPRFAATEKRSISQVVLADKAAADAFAAKVKAGTPIDNAAKALGLAAAKLPGVERKAYAEASGAELAAQVFGAAKGATIGPVKAPLGWTVAHVDAIETAPAKTLDEVRAELTKEVAATKVQRAMADLSNRINDAVDARATFTKIVTDNKLTVVTTAPLLPDGTDPANPAAKPDPAVAAVAKAAFAAQSSDGPQVVATGADGAFAVVAVAKVVAAAPPPPDELRQAIARDFTIDRARRAARVVAVDVVRKVKGGMALAEALKATKLALPAIEPAAASRAQLQASAQNAPPPLALMFTLAPRTAKILEAPNGAGWLIVYLEAIEPGDARGKPEVVRAQQNDLARVFGTEYVRQFIAAMRAEIGVTKHDDVIGRVRRELLGTTTGTAP